MSLGQVSIAAATAVVSYDLAQNTVWQQSDKPRRIRSAGLAGSAAALDTKVDVMIGAVKVGEMYNTSTGAVSRDADMFNFGSMVPPGTEVHFFVVDAPATNPINLTVDFQD